MRTHGTQGGEHHTPGPDGAWGARGERALGQIANACGASNLDDWWIGAAKHRGTRVSMFQTCTSCTCTPELGRGWGKPKERTEERRGGGEEREKETERERKREREKERERERERERRKKFNSGWIPFL